MKLLFSFLLTIWILLGPVLAGGIHKILNTRWDFPNEGVSSKLFLYFTLDNKIPTGGYLRIVLPSDLDFSPSSCRIWNLEEGFEYPKNVQVGYYGEIT